MNFSSFAPSSFFVTLTCNDERFRNAPGKKIYGHINDFITIETNDGARTQIEACRAREQVMAEACETRDDDDAACPPLLHLQPTSNLPLPRRIAWVKRQ